MRNFLILTVILVFTSFFAASAQNYQVHSVYIYSYMKYIKWPDASDNEPFKLGIMGESEVTPWLEKLAADRKAGNRPIRLVRLDTAAQISGVDMVFIPSGSPAIARLPEIHQQVSQENIVLLTEEFTFPAGGHINFVEENNKLFFQLDRQALEAAGLRVAAELMALARPVH